MAGGGRDLGEKGEESEGGSVPHLGSGWGGARCFGHGSGRRRAEVALAAALQGKGRG